MLSHGGMVVAKHKTARMRDTQGGDSKPQEQKEAQNEKVNTDHGNGGCDVAHILHSDGDNVYRALLRAVP
jgi:hypothetical protein